MHKSRDRKSAHLPPLYINYTIYNRSIPNCVRTPISIP